MSRTEELHNWLNGTPTGGPEGDGRYPLTFADGETYLVYSPAAQALNPSVSEEPVEVFANTASAAAGQATQAADAAVQARTDAASYAGSAQTSATEALSYRNTASTHATTATTKASEASSSATAAAGSASTASTANTNAQSAKTAAEAARDKAEDWADKNEDSPVETGKFSARHWALKAAASAAALASLAWDMVQNKPATATRWPTWGEVTSKPTTATRWPAWGEVTGKPSTFAPSSHTHTIANVTGLQAGLDAKFDSPSGTTSQYIRGNGSLATFPSIPAGTVTSVAGGNGLSGTVTSSGSITLGTPGTLSGSTSNAVQTSSHTHALSANLKAWDGVTVASKADSARTITAGNGLSGGGSLASNRTITLGTPGTLSGSTSNAVQSTSHTHALSTNLKAWDAISPTNPEFGSKSDGTSATKVLTVSSNGYAGLFVNGDAGNTSGEPGGSFITLGIDGGSHDTGTTKTFLSAINTAGEDGVGGTWDGTSSNSGLLATRGNYRLQLGSNGLVAMYMQGANATFNGDITTGQRVYVGNGGQVRSNSSNHIVISATGGTVYLRPNGDGSSTGQFTVNTSGNTVVTGTLTAGGTRVPKTFVQSGDPGSNASTGDLWIW